jgi:hypothetical protein
MLQIPMAPLNEFTYMIPLLPLRTQNENLQRDAQSTSTQLDALVVTA